MQVQARLRNLRMSPRKVRLVIDLVRGMKASSAIHQLEFCNKAAAEPVLKLLKSAMANAEHNHQIDPADLRIAKVTADGGPTLKRWRARAFGRAAPIRKRTSHITLVLSDESIQDVHTKKIAKAEDKKKEQNKKKETASAVKEEVKKEAPKKKATKSKAN